MKQNQWKKTTERTGGFSLLEMVIVLGIIGLIVATAAGLSMKFLELARIKTTEGRLSHLTANLLAYQSLTGRFPTESQGLKALLERPTSSPVPRSWQRLLDKAPRDSWDRDYLYTYPGSSDPDRPEVISAGRDGEFGTDDDISSQGDY